MGGIKKPDFIEKSDQEIEKIALAEIRDTLKSTSIPDVLKIFRYPAAIPQYEASTAFRLKAIEEMQHQYPGLFLAGNIRDGIGMADRVKQAKQTVNALIHEHD
jgi:oxygen-dependent protoporphyrinogen oxidase